LNNIWVNVHAAENSPQMRHRDVPFVGTSLIYAMLLRAREVSIEFLIKPNAQNVVVQSDVALRMLKSGNSCLQPIVIAVQ
jgi:hypothetical protein